MTIAAWPCPDTGMEYAVAFDRGRTHRLLILPAWFDEANKLRHQTVETMRHLDAAGIDSFLPDLPGCNESAAQLSVQTLEGWRNAAKAAAAHFDANRLLTIRAGAMLAPRGLPGWRYATLAGKTALRGLLRARTIAAREAGREEKIEALLAQGLDQGLDLAGYRLGADMIRQLSGADTIQHPELEEIPQSALGGAALWLRAEPDFDKSQAEALAAFLIAGMAT